MKPLFRSINDFGCALPSSLDPSLPIRATVREIHHDPAAPRIIYSPTFIWIGQPLVHAESSHELCMALVDALLGWLSLHQSGFVHRDVSIANVLLTGSEPIEIPTNIPLCSPGVKDYLSANITSDAPPADSPASPAQLAAEIAALLAKLPAARTYAAAFVVDGDVATDWRTNLDSEAPTTLWRPFSGPLLRTPEFMSLRLHQAIRRDDPYVQSPIDDIESFFWLALWATLFNRHYPSETRSKIETDWQKIIDSANYEEKATFTAELRNLTFKAVTKRSLTLSSITKELLPLLWDWWNLQEKLRRNWQETIDWVEDVPDLRQRTKICLDKFRLFAFCGVRDVLQLVVGHRNRLHECPVFPDPLR